ncbi:MAG: hypothetical protein ACRDSP_04365 [Pseudonocardiaceae bacterium]
MKQIVRGPLVLSMVDTRTGTQHRVAVDIAATHRHSGRYPALCGADVASASLTTAPTGNCRECADRVRRPDAAPRRRSLLRWLRRPAASR